MIEISPAGKALGTAFAERHSFYRLHVPRFAVIAIITGVLRCNPRDFLQALFIARMGRQPVGRRRCGSSLRARAVCRKTLLTVEGLDDIDHVAWVVVVAREILGAQLIGLELLLPAVVGDVARRDSLRDLPHHLARAGHAGIQQHPQHAGGEHAQTGALLPGGALRTVSCGDMTDFVTHDPGKIGFAIHVGHQAARDIDISARQRERIDLRTVEHREMPFKVPAVGLRGKSLTQFVHIILQRLAGISTEFGQDLLMRLLAFGDLARFVHHRALGFARDRIGDRRTADQQYEQSRGYQVFHRRFSLWVAHLDSIFHLQILVWRMGPDSSAAILHCTSSGRSARYARQHRHPDPPPAAAC